MDFFKKLTASLLLAIIFSSAANAQNNKIAPKNPDSTFVFIQDDPIVAMLDSLVTAQFFECNNFTTDTCLLNVHNYNPNLIPVFDDMVYEARMAKLDAKSPFSLDYNSAVQSYIDVYASRKRAMVSRMLGLAQIYFPLFEEKLDKYNLPLELKYLAIVESALNPNAVSKSGATGLWQFMYPTGKMFGLNVTSYLDERRDPYKATESACKYFLHLYKIFGDWHLVLAAYNGGPGTVNKAIRRSGGKMNYWQIRPYLPLETQGYVPAFIAVNYIMNHTVEHNLYPVAPKNIYMHTDTIKVKQQVSFSQIASIIDLPVEDLEYLNPAYKQKVIPFNEEKQALCLPAHKVGAFLNNEDIIYNYKKDTFLDSLFASMPLQVQKTHKVKRGETLSALSKKYNCSVADLKKWNNIKTSIKPGKTLVVWIPVKEKKPLERKEIPLNKDSVNTTEVASETKSSKSIMTVEHKKTEPKPAKKNSVVYYTVQSGDTLWEIANKKGVTVEQLKKMNGLTSKKVIKPGMKLKISLG